MKRGVFSRSQRRVLMTSEASMGPSTKKKKTDDPGRDAEIEGHRLPPAQRKPDRLLGLAVCAGGEVTAIGRWSRVRESDESGAMSHGACASRDARKAVKLSMGH